MYITKIWFSVDQCEMELLSAVNVVNLDLQIGSAAYKIFEDNFINKKIKFTKT